LAQDFGSKNISCRCFCYFSSAEFTSLGMRRVLLSSALAGSCLGTLLIDPIPLNQFYDKTLSDYKTLKWDTISRPDKPPEAGKTQGQKMVRLKNAQDAEFNELVRKGYPFIVDDCAPHSKLSTMPCSEYGERFPKEHMKAEYTPGQAHVYLEDKTWHSVKKPTESAPRHLSEGKPLSGPYVWHVKDETVDKKTKPFLQERFPVPYFLNKSIVNSFETKDSFEFWFGLEEGGTQAHADAYCETTISLQVRGRKVWRLGAYPNISNAFQPYTFHDGDIYRMPWHWAPEYEEMVEAGQCLVFPMGYIHETYIYPGDGGEDVCSVATTFQIQDPQAVHQWRNFMTRWGLSHYARDEPCLDRMAPYVSMGTGQDGKPLTGKDDEEVKANAKKAFAKIDKDGDGIITKAELTKKTKYEDGFPWTEVKKDKALLKKAVKEKEGWMVEDMMLYHDTDKDGDVSLMEFTDSVLKFHAVYKRMKTIKKTKSKPALLKLEREWIRKHLCDSDDCEYLKQLERDFVGKGGPNGEKIEPYKQRQADLKPVKRLAEETDKSLNTGVKADRKKVVKPKKEL